LKELRHPNMVSLIEDGVAEISSLSESRYIVIVERPVGKSLEILFTEAKSQVSEALIINYFLRPLVEILKKFNRSSISHNRINLANIHMNNNNIILGECISEPSGFSQDYVFEPIERAVTSPLGKADHSISSDCYALAVLVLHVSLGFKPFSKIDKEGFIDSLLTKGSYQTLALEWDFSENMHDFFRGLLNDTRRERWDPDSIDSWIAGRKFNLITPSPPRETVRPFELLGQQYYNRKSIANAFFRQWNEARIILSDNRLARWVETSIHKSELSDMVLRICSYSRSDNLRFENQNNESFSKIITLFDPAGPIRIKNLAVHIDTIGNILTIFFLKGMQEEINTVVHIIESELIGFWIEQQKDGVDYANVIWKAQKIRSVMKIKAFGFGIERCIYDLNPEMSCQSKIVKNYHITNLNDLLIALDVVASQKSGDEDFMDRHLSAFISSKLEITREQKIPELDAIPKLASNNSLIGLKLLIRAQSKANVPPLRGLSYWIAIRLMPLISNIHKRSLRQKFYKDLMNATASGSLKEIGDLFFNPEVFVSDHLGFQNALSMYAIRKMQINDLRNNNVLIRHSQVAGRGIAQITAYGICLSALYYSLKVYLRF
ncbi:MAG: hypothetical protein WCJ33_02920, partial [Pseudomonadota bacterium]